MREIILDTETTGLDPQSGHKIIEIACVEFENFNVTGNVFHTYINPLRNIPLEAQRIHGISTDFLQNKPIFSKIAKDFLDFIKDDQLVIHNAKFDLKFLNYELNECGFQKLSNPIVDTLLLAKQKFPGSPANLDALCKRFSVDNSKRDKHGAVIDCELLAEVYVNLLGGRQSKLELEKNQQKTQECPIINTEQFLYKKRTFNISDEELEIHKQMVNDIKNSIWNQ